MNSTTYLNKINWHEKPKYSKSQTNSLVLAKYTSIGYYLIAPLLIGVFFGLSFDRVFDTGSLFTLGFLVFGMIATFYNLYSLVKKID